MTKEQCKSIAKDLQYVFNYNTPVKTRIVIDPGDKILRRYYQIHYYFEYQGCFEKEVLGRYHLTDPMSQITVLMHATYWISKFGEIVGYSPNEE